MTIREMDRRDALREMDDDVAAGLYDCTRCGTNVAEFVTTEGLLCRPCHVEEIGPVEDDDDEDDPEAHHAPMIPEMWA